MSLQVIKSVDGKPEYVLLPISVYQVLRSSIDKELTHHPKEGDYEPFKIEDYVDNPVALARIQAHVTQEELAELMKVTQAYVSKIERQPSVTPKILIKVEAALTALKKKHR